MQIVFIKIISCLSPILVKLELLFIFTDHRGQ